ncbi:terpene synthase family protein [Burkholderia singularis]|uniref:Uncharacterized protein n=1 Tax=Burkholderia singularis TaxID=1503053 RepID=A0A238H2W4_9BURK|nr:terpene cyclase [Burkholderia singularis]SMF99602.1 FIG00456465: hypothetical protein [Burkholderia singularis]
MDVSIQQSASHWGAVPAEFAIPLVESAFVLRHHEDGLRLREHSRRWMLEHRLVPVDVVGTQADGLRYTELVASYSVGAPFDALCAISDLSIWFFVWDDKHGRYAFHHQHGQWAALRDALYRVVDAPAAYSHDAEPLLSGLADCLLRFHALMSEHWNTSIAEHLRAVIHAYDIEYRERINNYVPPIDDYVKLRAGTFGYRVWLDCLELAAGRTLPADIRQWGEYRRAGLASQEFAGWYNDLCSIRKELAAGELHNLGITMIKHRGLSVGDAIDEVRERVITRVEDFLLAERAALERVDRANLPSEIADAVRHCVFNMRNWISSVYWFHHASERYNVNAWADRSHPPYVVDA